LSGQLVALGLPEVAKKALMKSKMNSYGKTWHLRRLVPGSKTAFAATFLPGDDLVFQELGGCWSPGVLFTTLQSPLAPSNFASSSLARTGGGLGGSGQAMVGMHKK